MKRFLCIAIFIMISVLLLGGCLTSPSKSGVEMTIWNHTVDAAEYTAMKTEGGSEYLVYRYDDERFNTEEWFDTWIEDWAGKTGGWSKFMPVFDPQRGMFMYDVVYNDGYVTWFAYPADLDLIVGNSLRFYRLSR